MPGVARTVERMLDALGYQQVDVLGVSLGGVIAQQFAHQAPDRVRRLVLAATGPGSSGWAGSRVAAGAAGAGHPPPLLPVADYYRRVAGLIYGGPARTDPDALLHGSMARFTQPPEPAAAISASCTRSAGWTGMPWLCRAAAADARADRRRRPDRPGAQRPHPGHLIPDADLHVVPGGGHLFVLENPAAVARDVADFLATADAERTMR